MRAVARLQAPGAAEASCDLQGWISRLGQDRQCKLQLAVFTPRVGCCGLQLAPLGKLPLFCYGCEVRANHLLCKQWGIALCFKWSLCHFYSVTFTGAANVQPCCLPKQMRELKHFGVKSSLCKSKTKQTHKAATTGGCVHKGTAACDPVAACLFCLTFLSSQTPLTVGPSGIP